MSHGYARRSAVRTLAHHECEALSSPSTITAFFADGDSKICVKMSRGIYKCD